MVMEELKDDDSDLDTVLRFLDLKMFLGLILPESFMIGKRERMQRGFDDNGDS